MTVIDDPYVAKGCPGGPGHPGAANRTLIVNTADELIEASDAGTFDELRPKLLTMCQCELAEIIDRLAQLAAADPHDVVA
jgi:hypothetical protein